MRKILNNKKWGILLLFISILFLIFNAVYPALAIPPGTTYSPGETLNPNCKPEDPNCTVTTPLTANNLGDYGVSALSGGSGFIVSSPTGTVVLSLDIDSTLTTSTKLGINLNNVNTWLAMQTFSASTTMASTSITYLTSGNVNITGGSLSGVTGTISMWNNDLGYVTSSIATGLTVSNFTSPNISQWTNDTGFVTSSGARLALASTATGLVYTSSTGIFSLDSNYNIPLTNSTTFWNDNANFVTVGHTNWDTAFSQTLQWNGGTTGLVAATGRTSLGLGTMALATSTDYANLSLANVFTGITNSFVSGTFSGNVGIGTTTPAYALDVVNGSGRIISSNPTLYLQNSLYSTADTVAHLGTVTFFDKNGAQGGFLGYGSSISNSFSVNNAIGPVRLVTGGTLAGNIRLNVDLNGNIGIGVGLDTPSTTLQVVSTSEQLRLGYNYSNYTSFTVGTNGALTITPTNSATTTITNGLIVKTNSLVVNQSTGNVGIGTLTPGGSLDVAGEIRFTANDAFEANVAQIYRSAVSGLVLTGYAGTTYDFIITESAGTNILVNPQGTNNLAVPNGWLGVGTTTPANALHVVSTAEQLRLGYDTTNYTSFTVNASGMLTITPTGNVTTTFTNHIAVNSITATSTFAGAVNIGSGALVYDYTNQLVSIPGLETGALNFPDDAGIVSWADMSVTTAVTTAGTVESYAAQLDGNVLLTIYGLSDGLGAVASTTVLIGTSTPLTTATVYKLQIDSGSTTGAGLAVNGYIKATSYITGTTTLDVAETYQVAPDCKENNTCPEVAELACLENTSTTFYISKCNINNKDNLLGVISTNPGMILGGSGLNDTGTVAEGYRAIALNGRVPVKVSNANGNIKPGDYLAASAVSGVAVKATQTGKVIGMALENFDKSENGAITVYISPQWYIGGDKSIFEIIENGIVKIKELWADKIKTKELCVGETCINETQLKTLLNNTGTGYSTSAPAPATAPQPEIIPPLVETPTPTIAPSSTQEIVPTPIPEAPTPEVPAIETPQPEVIPPVIETPLVPVESLPVSE